MIYKRLLSISKYTLPFLLAYRIISGITWLEKEEDFVMKTGLEMKIEERYTAHEPEHDDAIDSIYNAVTLIDKFKKYGGGR